MTHSDVDVVRHMYFIDIVVNKHNKMILIYVTLYIWLNMSMIVVVVVAQVVVI